MKWIGQHIYDLIARFRNDIYLENISSGTIASGGNLGLDSNNKIVKQDDAGITDLHGAGVDGSNNQLLTDDGDGTVTSEANLTFDGSTLSIEADANTTQHALFIDMNSTTSGQAINVDIDHSNTGSTSVIGQYIDLAKSGVTGDGASAAQYGFALGQNDLATNHANSTVVQQGIRSTVSSASTSGTNTNTALYLESTGATTNLGIDVKTTDTTTALNGAGFINRSSVNDGSYFLINTQARGATEIATADHIGSNGGSVTFNTDGRMYFNAQGETQFYFSDIDETDDGFSIYCGTNGKTTLSTFRGSSGLNTEDDQKIYIASKGVEIDNPSDSGNTALRIDNDEIDEIALQIDAANRSANVLQIDATDVDTGNIIFIDSHSLTTGSAITLDVEDILTAASTKALFNIDYDKSGVTGSSQVSTTTALEISMHDGATNHASSTVINKGVNVTIDAASDQGNIQQRAFEANCTDADGGTSSIGYFSNVEDGGFDFWAHSSADHGDYFSIATTTHGATTLTTVDDDATAAHFEVAADGNITLDAAGDIYLEAGGSDVYGDARFYTFSHSGAESPNLSLVNNTNDATGPIFTFKNLRDGSGLSANDELGSIDWRGLDGSGNAQNYAKIVASAASVTHTDESGEIELLVTASDGTTPNYRNALKAYGHGTGDRVNVNLGYGAEGDVSCSGSLSVVSGATINNPSDGGTASLTVANLDVDQNAFHIDADANTTGHAISVDANSLTTGNAIFVDVDSALTDTNTLDCMKIDYDKSGNAASGQTVTAYGLEIDMNDNATSNVGNTQMTGIHIGIDSANANGLALHTGVAVSLTDADTALTTGFASYVEDGGVDFKAQSSADSGDYFTIATTTHGATTLTTVDDDATAAHFEIAADGNITLDAAGDIALEAGGNDVSIVAGDLTMYDAVNDGNPTVRIGSSATNNFEIKPVYNSGAQTIDSVDFTTYTTSSSSNDGRYRFFVDEVELARILDGSMFVNGSFNAKGDGAYLQTKSETTSSATEGGKLRLICDDGAAMGNDHRLGVVQFEGAEDASSNFTIGAQIEAFCEAAWSATENGARMVFSTTDGNASTSEVLRLDSNKLSTFSGAVDISPANDVGAPALLIDNDDVDQIALSIDAANTTASVINVDSHSLDDGKMFLWDYNDARTNSSTNYGFHTDIDKTGVVASGQTTRTTAYYANFIDGATNVGTSYFTGFEVESDDVNDDGTNVRTAFKGTVTDGDANTTFGLFLKIQDGGKELLFQSSEDSGDQAHWITTTNGATTITTQDDDGEAAHFEIAADGDITLDSAAQIKLEPAAGSNILLDGTVAIDAGVVTGATSITSTTFVGNRTLAVTSATDGDHDGDVVYFGGTTSMTIGKIYHYKSDGTWELANADAVATADGLLGVALGAASDTNGMLLRGMVTLDHDPGAIGDVLYVQSDNAGTPGNATATAPSASGDCVRIIGYQVSHASNGNIWFNPDSTFVEVA